LYIRIEKLLARKLGKGRAIMKNHYRSPKEKMSSPERSWNQKKGSKGGRSLETVINAETLRQSSGRARVEGKRVRTGGRPGIGDGKKEVDGSS